ncbi:ATP-dependent DNA helicase [Trichonephila clavata]|uniref:ATP-dependent DNA helicase n=1 Tax=Trichonephila clavata TaxID=2740835 RepID=A0A8X6GYE4_TRICU|nr:ATP-dependent DNA helicase [Trichonephila clavata]
MLNKLGAIPKKKENIMFYDDLYDLMGRANEEQREILFHIMHHLISIDESMREPLLIYLTRPAGSVKTFVVKGIIEIYNRFSDTYGIFNAYIACASTGKTVTGIGDSTVHSALSISLSRIMPLNIEKVHQYRTLFKFVKVLIIDEVSMEFELKQVMRQENSQFVEILTKIGNGNILTEEEIQLIESRFITKDKAQSVCPEGIRLIFTNAAVNEYNHSILNSEENKTISLASDVFIGCHNAEQENFVRQKLH